MDNMKLHFDLPQEDELATNLLSGCQVSPYSSLFFMRDEVDYRKYQCLLENKVSSQDVDTWTYYFLAVLRKIQLRDVLGKCKQQRKQRTTSNDDSNISKMQHPRQLLLKSPCHTGKENLQRLVYLKNWNVQSFTYFSWSFTKFFRKSAFVTQTIP